jgi:hypothetical protein
MLQQHTNKTSKPAHPIKKSTMGTGQDLQRHGSSISSSGGGSSRGSSSSSQVSDMLQGTDPAAYTQALLQPFQPSFKKCCVRAR